MATLSPAALFPVKQNAGLFRERDVVERLGLSLPEDYEVFHSLAWHNVDRGIDRHGEIDVVVLAPNGNVLLLEVKAGELEARDGALYKLYVSGEHDVGRQSRIQYRAIVNRLQEVGLAPYVTNCVVLPDFHIDPDITIVSLPRERIIEAST